MHSIRVIIDARLATEVRFREEDHSAAWVDETVAGRPRRSGRGAGAVSVRADAVLAPQGSSGNAGPQPRGRMRGDLRIALLTLGLVVLVVVSFGLGRYVLTPWKVAQVFLGQVITIPVHWTSTDQTVILQIRLPRILGALLVEAALAASGAAYQTTFRNPLVSPEAAPRREPFTVTMRRLLPLPLASAVRLTAWRRP